MLSIIILIISVLAAKASLPNDCEAIVFNKTTEALEKTCLGLWYVYGGNEKCENCCLIRNLTEIKPGLIKKQHFFKKDNEYPELLIMYAIREGKSAKYKHQSSDITAKVVGADCNKYAVAVKKDKLMVYTREKDPSDIPNSIEGLNKCGLNFYKYNPDKNCLKSDLSLNI